MVKLFKKKSKVATRDFKFNTSLKLKSLPLEEYAHVSYAFQVAILRFERILKESLLEGYITSTTLEKISQEFNLSEIRDLEIPDTPSLQTIFGSEAPAVTAKKPILEAISPTPTIDIAETPTPKPITPEAPSITPSTIIPTEPTPDAKPTTPSIPAEPKTRPTISFSFPETPAEPKEVAPSPTPTSTGKITPPTIPKISFPSKPTTPPAISPLSRSTSGREEDRATGIAILRKQMLTELKKIRSVVSEQDQ
ncbi:MAG: hypothetical protein JSW11_13805 [Candidatus Heimdallarchaeota archaeon]|nr:MAG: hypothetical protein JSW11_13805 [Candidatus Heimdallarchaeota archaeon]